MKTKNNATNLTLILSIILGMGFIASLFFTAMIELNAPGRVTVFPFMVTGLGGTLTGMLLRLEPK